MNPTAFLVLSNEAGCHVDLGTFESLEEASRFVTAIPHISARIIEMPNQDAPLAALALDFTQLAQ